jgi:AraC family transcriptional regulator, regulatory protein of adaptative response / methylated-DNA-[protein]-cysteine methyltransferase
MTEIAMQAGFGSLRFNSAFAEVYGRPPTEIRRKRRSGVVVLA